MIVNAAVAQAKSRLVAMRLTSLTLRSMEYWSRLASDYEEGMILVAVAAITTDRLSRTDMTGEQLDLSNPLPADAYAKCTIQAISQATGLNRETARRKVNDLVARGYLTRPRRNSIAFRAGFQQEKLVLEAVAAQLEAFRRTADGLLRDGVLQVKRS